MKTFETNETTNDTLFTDALKELDAAAKTAKDGAELANLLNQFESRFDD